MARVRLLSDAAVWVTSCDRTLFGSPVGPRPDEETRRLFAPVLQHVERHGVCELPKASFDGLVRAMAGEAFARVTEQDGRGGWRVRSEVLYPDIDSSGPYTLTLARPDVSRAVHVDLPPEMWPAAHELIAALTGEGYDERSAVAPFLSNLFSGMFEEGFVDVDADGDGLVSTSHLPEITFAGHNTVVVRSATTSVVLDPFLLAHRTTFPATYQPLTRRDLGPIDGVVLTHSHPDHFDPGSLLRFRPETCVVVPVLARETVLSVDMATRLRQLGFEDVRSLPWGERLRVGDIEIAALPFYGEQPAEDDVFHPEVRNAGNTYVVRTPALSAAFLADSGRDPSGDVKDLARAWRLREGPVDVVFSGYRGWYLYPPQLLFSSVSRYLLFVPPWLWGTRQQLMSGVDDAIDIAERWGARYLIPYADGGAPWYWDIGLGPRLDGTGEENVTFDPFPERVVEAAQRRGQSMGASLIRSPVQVLLLRPGDSVTLGGAEPRVVRMPGHQWPYGSPVDGSAQRRHA